jgi:hypothetical protein
MTYIALDTAWIVPDIRYIQKADEQDNINIKYKDKFLAFFHFPFLKPSEPITPGDKDYIWYLES